MTDPTDPPTGHWFTDVRVARIGDICAKLLMEPSHWIDRRKDSLTIVDDAALRWQNSVDFELPADVPPVERARPGQTDPLYCAPLYVLPKRPSHYMAFDLTDETGHSLSLTSRVENARISAAIMRAMAEQIVQQPLAAEVAREIEEIALSESPTSKHRARRLLNPLPGDSLHSQWTTLATALNGRFGWWLRCVAESSIVVVPFRAAPAQRKGIKLSYEVQFEIEIERRVKLGWKPYEVIIDQPFVEARSYHFEAKAPSGLRIAHAGLSDESGQRATFGGEFKRRVHLYRKHSQSAGSAAGTMKLRVSPDGFLTGAWLSGALVAGALIVCDRFAAQIAQNPTSAPALLLFLPGVLASYVGRPDRHAMTTRMLSWVRNLVLGCAFVAYGAGIAVALTGKSSSDKNVISDRVDHLHWWLTGAAIVTGVFCLLLLASWACSHPTAHKISKRNWWTRLRKRFGAQQFALEQTVRTSPAELVDALHSKGGAIEYGPKDEELLEEYPTLKPRLSPHLFILRRTSLGGAWTYYLYANDDPGGALGTVRAVYHPRLLFRPARALFVVREKDRVAKQLKNLEIKHALPTIDPSGSTPISR